MKQQSHGVWELENSYKGVAIDVSMIFQLFWKGVAPPRKKNKYSWDIKFIFHPSALDSWFKQLTTRFHWIQGRFVGFHYCRRTTHTVCPMANKWFCPCLTFSLNIFTPIWPFCGDQIMRPGSSKLPFKGLEIHPTQTFTSDDINNQWSFRCHLNVVGSYSFPNLPQFPFTFPRIFFKAKGARLERWDMAQNSSQKSWGRSTPWASPMSKIGFGCKNVSEQHYPVRIYAHQSVDVHNKYEGRWYLHLKTDSW